MVTTSGGVELGNGRVRRRRHHRPHRRHMRRRRGMMVMMGVVTRGQRVAVGVVMVSMVMRGVEAVDAGGMVVVIRRVRMN